MHKRKLGRTHLHVSELGLNTSKMVWMDDEAAAFGLLDAYYTCGGSFLQTVGFCPNSITAQPYSESEDIVARWRESRGIPRDQLVVATRLNLFRPMHGGAIAFANVIREACEGSLRRLRTNHLDLVICEWDEQLTPISDALEAIDQLIRAGLVRHAVAGNFPPWRVTDSLHRSSVRNHCRFEAIQSEYSLITRARFEAEALAMCREHRLGFLARSPLAGGYLTQQPTQPRDVTNADRWLNGRFDKQYGEAVLAACMDLALNALPRPRRSRSRGSSAIHRSRHRSCLRRRLVISAS